MAYIVSSIYVIFVQRVTQLLNELAKDRVDAKKPREEGLSFTIDKLRSFDRDNFEIIASSEKDAEFFSQNIT